MVDPELVGIGAEAPARLTGLGVMPEPGGEGEEPQPDAGAQARECADESSAEPCPEVADDLPEFLFVDEDGNFFDPEGNPFDFETLTKHPQYKAPEEWTD